MWNINNKIIIIRFNNKIIYLTIQFLSTFNCDTMCLKRVASLLKGLTKTKNQEYWNCFYFYYLPVLALIYIIYTIKVLHVRYSDCKCCTVYCFQLDLGILITYSKVTSICGNQIHFFVLCLLALIDHILYLK